MVSGPISYEVDGEQYIAVTVGWGTVFGLISPGEQRPVSRVLSFRVGGEAALPEPELAAADWPEPPPVTGSAAQIAEGKAIYLESCFMCHGDAAMSGGVLPDLRKLPPERHALWSEIVLDGALAERGMPGFAGRLSAAEAAAIQQYVIQRAHDTRQVAAQDATEAAPASGDTSAQ